MKSTPKAVPESGSSAAHGGGDGAVDVDRVELSGRVAADAADAVQHSRRRPEVDAHQELAVGEPDDPLARSDIEAPVAVPVVLTVTVEECAERLRRSKSLFALTR